MRYRSVSRVPNRTASPWPGPRPHGRRGAVAWPLAASLAVVVGGLMLISFASTPEQVRRCCSVVDVVVTCTIDEWLGVDTMQVPGLRPEDLPAHDFFAALMFSSGITHAAPIRHGPAGEDGMAEHLAEDP